MLEWISVVATVMTAVAAAYAAWSARQAAERMQQIETTRLHCDLRPEIPVDVTPLGEEGCVDVRLTVRFAGPAELRVLDQLRCRILNDKVHLSSGLANGPSPEQIKEQLWSPLRMRPGTECSGAKVSEDGREITIHGPIEIGDPFVFQLEPTPAPTWSTPESSKTQFDGRLRIELEAVSGAFRPWFERVERPV